MDNAPRPLRLWPGVLAVGLQLGLRYGLLIFFPDAVMLAVIGPLALALLIVIWWMFFSRALWGERVGALVLMSAGWLITSRFVDKSLATGLQGLAFAVYSVPFMCLALVVWAAFSQRMSRNGRIASLVATTMIACGAWMMLRTEGITGDARTKFNWRWATTHEETLASTAPLPLAASTPVVAAPAPVPELKPVTSTPKPAASSAIWPGFRGPNRDSVIPGVRINTDWAAAPPVELWRRPVGPGWSSFAVQGDLIYTQEQRGDEEVVACYNAASGKPVWAHRDATRFWESNAGAGPRSTPTLHNGRVYTFGATGIVNSLDARDGRMLWTHNAGTDASVKVPGWGFASSPLIVGDAVVIAASGHLIAYDAASGAQRWIAPSAGGSYSSPHFAMIHGVPQIMLVASQGVTSVAPADGTLLWKYAWTTDTRIVQPAITAEGDLLITSGDGMGGASIRRVAITHAGADWKTEDRWTSNGLKANFNDFVVHDGYIYGFDGAILSCVDAQDGKRKWKGGRYGEGQLVLLGDQGVLLVLTEEGQLALVKASPDQFTELAHFPAMDNKTWNHPVLAGDRLLVRNGDEMVAFRLAMSH